MSQQDDEIVARLFSLSEEELATIIEFIGIRGAPDDPDAAPIEGPLRTRNAPDGDGENDAG